jgi:hypothetical protein
MYIEFVKRIEGGKTIRVCMDYEDNKIKNIFFSGDFFLYPEEMLNDLNNKINGKELNEQLKNEIVSYLKPYTIIGAKPSDFYDVIVEAINSGKNVKS